MIRTITHGMSRSALALVACLALAAPAWAEPQTPTLQVSATATVSGEADIAHIRVGVTTEGVDAARTRAENASRMSQTFEAVRALGITDADLATENVSLVPRYARVKSAEGDARRIDGYEATTTLRITVRDLDQVGAVLDAVVAAEANQIQGVEFAIEDTSSLEEQARMKAAQALVAKARQYAAGLGTEVRGVMSIVEQGGMGGPVPMMRTMAMNEAASMPVAPADVDVSITLMGSFEIDAKLK